LGKVVQVPMDEELISALDDASEKERSSRSAVIRRACQDYLRRTREEQWDRAYEEGYRRIPEDTSTGKSQVRMLKDMLGKESE
jgi:metal-responsive CopG/Arc/MetJ family transcriptional regulator